MKHLKTFENNDERSSMIDELCAMGYDKSTCDAMSYEELCDLMEKELLKDEDTYEDTYESTVNEGLLKALGIKKMSERVGNKLGFIEDDFNPSSDLKIYLRHASDRDMNLTNDMSVIEEALRKAKDVNFGLSFWKDEPDLSKMEGSEEEKKVALYLIKRAVNSIQSTSSAGGHEFGQKPNISGLSDSASYSNLKHLKSFESFNSINEEGKFREFFTGHASKEEKEAAKSKFMKAIDDAEAALKKNPDDYAGSSNWSETKKKLIKKAESDNFKGGLRVQRGGRDSRFFIVYDEGATGFEKMAGAAAGEANIRK
jgi:hypothetical protein